MALCSFDVKRIFFGLIIDFVISPIIIYVSSISRPTYGCPVNNLANAWLWVSHIKFTIHPSPPNTGFARSLKGHPHFILLVIIRTKSFLYALYFSLLSQPIKTNRVYSLFLVDVSDLIITAIKSISYTTTIWGHCNMSSWIAKGNKRNHTYLILFKDSFTLTKYKIEGLP